jgi:hypothetical protein
MTLDTRIYVLGEVDHREVFAKCNALIGAHENVKRSDDGAALMNEPDQGLPGWLMVYYGPDGALRPEPEGCDKWCDEDCDGDHQPACWLEVSLDTTYGYQDELGGCGDLHARFTAALGRWLNERGVPWAWMNEFTGEIHQGDEGLDELGKGALAAAAWMHGSVLPAIAARIAGH